MLFCVLWLLLLLYFVIDKYKIVYKYLDMMCVYVCIYWHNSPLTSLCSFQYIAFIDKSMSVNINKTKRKIKRQTTSNCTNVEFAFCFSFHLFQQNKKLQQQQQRNMFNDKPNNQMKIKEQNTIIIWN